MPVSMSVTRRIIAAFDEQMGITINADQFEAYPDPHHDVYAVRITTSLGNVSPNLECAEFLLHEDNELEEVEFTQWPPSVHGGD